MKVLTRKSDIVINNRKMRVGELVANLKSLPSTEVRDFFVKEKKSMPRDVRIDALRVVIDNQLKDKKVASTLTDEMNYRLNWYTKFSEYQLENLLAFFNNESLTDIYKEELWISIISRHSDLGIDDITIFTLYQKSINFRIESNVVEGLMDYNRNLDSVFYDEENSIDGLSYSEFRENLLQSSTLVELRELGSKYGIDVPRRIKKNELMDIIVDELKKQDKFTPEIEEKITKMSVVGLQRLAKDNGIKASIELKKEDIIEYIIKFANSDVKPVAIPKKTTVEPVQETVVVDEEPEVEEIEEKETEPQKMGEVDFSNLDIADLFSEESSQTITTKDPVIVVPESVADIANNNAKEEATEAVEEEPVAAPETPIEEDFNEFDFNEFDMGMDTQDVLGETIEPVDNNPFEETANEGNDAMEGVDLSDLDLFIPDDDTNDSVFQFQDANYEDPTTPSQDDLSHMSSSNDGNTMNGFKSELNEFNKKLESLLAFQMKMLEKNNQTNTAQPEKKAEAKTLEGDLFTTVQAEVKEEKIQQARGLDELRKMAEANGGVMPGVKTSIVQDSYLGTIKPNKKVVEKENKRRKKERERAKKFMSPEELEYALEQEKREKEMMKRQRDAEKAKKENQVSSNSTPLIVKIMITLVIIAIVAIVCLLVVYILCKNKVVTDGFIREIYDFFRRLAGRTK